MVSQVNCYSAPQRAHTVPQFDDTKVSKMPHNNKFLNNNDFWFPIIYCSLQIYFINFFLFLMFIGFIDCPEAHSVLCCANLHIFSVQQTIFNLFQKSAQNFIIKADFRKKYDFSALFYVSNRCSEQLLCFFAVIFRSTSSLLMDSFFVIAFTVTVTKNAFFKHFTSGKVFLISMHSVTVLLPKDQILK